MYPRRGFQSRTNHTTERHRAGSSSASKGVQGCHHLFGRERIRTAHLTDPQRQASARIAFATAKSGGETSLEGPNAGSLLNIVVAFRPNGSLFEALEPISSDRV